jgi:hypothetical protein
VNSNIYLGVLNWQDILKIERNLERFQGSYYIYEHVDLSSGSEPLPIYFLFPDLSAERFQSHRLNFSIDKGTFHFSFNCRHFQNPVIRSVSEFLSYAKSLHYLEFYEECGGPRFGAINKYELPFAQKVFAATAARYRGVKCSRYCHHSPTNIKEFKAKARPGLNNNSTPWSLFNLSAFYIRNYYMFHKSDFEEQLPKSICNRVFEGGRITNILAL